jgi:hypothetical protein
MLPCKAQYHPGSVSSISFINPWLILAGSWTRLSAKPPLRALTQRIAGSIVVKLMEGCPAKKSGPRHSPCPHEILGAETASVIISKH